MDRSSPSRTACGARPSGRARIETAPVRGQVAYLHVAPGLRVGRGLKPVVGEQAVLDRNVAPGLRVGRGLKLLDRTGRGPSARLVAPGLRVGRGLKRLACEADRRPADGGARPSGRA